MQGSGEPVLVEPKVVEMAACDAQQLGRLDQQPVDAHAGVHVTPLPRATQTIPPAVRRHVLRRDHGRCVVPGCRHATYVDCTT